MKRKVVLRYLVVIGLVGGLAWLWVMLSATPVWGIVGFITTMAE